MVIYVDILLFINIVVNTAILWCTAKLVRTDVKPLRFLCAVFICCVYGFAVVLPNLGVLLNVFVKFIISAVIVFVAFGGKPLRGFLKKYFMFLLVSVSYIAFLLILQSAFRLQHTIYIRNGSVYFNLPVFYILLAVVVLCATQLLVNRILEKKPPQKSICECVIDFCGKKKKINCLVDTGNFLREGITGLPVVIVDRFSVSGFLDVDDSGKILFDKNSPLQTRFRMIPYRSADGQRGMMNGFRPDGFEVAGKKYKVVVAVSKNRMDTDGRYHGIVPVLNGEV